jgi:hypothetical protein
VGSLVEKTTRTLAAGVRGLVRSLVVVVVMLTISVFALQAGLQWFVRGTFEPFPSGTPAEGRASEVKVLDATPQQAIAIRRAVSALRYHISPNDVTFSVVDIVECPECRGEYVPALQQIQLQRQAVDAGGAALQYAVAHEAGHLADATRLTEVQRQEFKRLRGHPDGLSWSAPEAPWAERPVEDFAEVFGALATPAISVPMGTAYGQLRDAAAAEEFLRDAGIRLDRESAVKGVRPALEQTAAFFVIMLENPTSRSIFSMLVALYVAVSVVISMREAWIV